MMRVRNIRVRLTSLLLLVCCAPAKQKEAPRVEPLWTADLNQFSFASRPELSKSYNTRGNLGVVATASGEVICYFVTKNGDRVVQPHELSESDPFRLQVIAFDADSGKLKSSHDLPARHGRSSVMVNNEDNLIIRTGDFLTLYSREFQVLKQRELPRTKEL